MFIETSAKAGYNVKTLFKKVAEALPGMQANAPPPQQTQRTFFFLFSPITTCQLTLRVSFSSVIDVQLKDPAAPAAADAGACSC